MTQSDPPVALVTGAAEGIGAAIAVRMAEAGYRVAVTAERALAAVCARLKELQQLAYDEVADLGSPQKIEKLIDRVVHATGRLDVLVNNAGVTLDQPIEQTTLEDFQRTLAVNLTAPWLGARACVPIMRDAGGGAIVNVSSVHARLSEPGHSVYAATKGGITALTQQLAVELAPVGIRVNAIEPGLIDVPRTHDVSSRPGVRASIPAGRAGMPTEVANAAVWLAGAEARYVTGATLRVDGGLSARLVLGGG